MAAVAPYPFEGLAPFPRQQWYLAAWSDEVGETPLERTLLGEPTLLYRVASGAVVALSALCPHRWAPLARGRRVGDRLECVYHGMLFESDGRCVRVPGRRQTVPRGSHLTAYPVIEQPPCVWLWAGDPSRADPALLPDAARAGLTAPGWTVARDPPQRVAVRAQLLLENLFDQSHIGTVHPTTLGGGMIPEGDELHVEEGAGWLRVSHALPVREADDSVRIAFPGAGSHVRSRIHTELLGVALVNSVGSETFRATPGGDFLEPLGRVNFLHALTPETAGSTHYFAALARDFAPDDGALAAAVMERNRLVVGEDVAVLSAIEAVVDRHGDRRREVSFPTDAMALRVRQRLRRLIEAEQAGSP